MAKTKSLKNEQSSARFQIPSENINETSIFDGAFELEDLILDHSAFSGAISNNATTQQPSLQTFLNPPIINRISNDQKNNISCSFVPNPCFPDDENFFNTFSESYDILDDFKTKPSSKSLEVIVKQDEDVCKPPEHILGNDLSTNFENDKNVHRRRDYSLSNDSGVEGCSFLDQTTMHSTNEPNFMTDIHNQTGSTLSQGYTNQFTNLLESRATSSDSTSSLPANVNKHPQNRCISNDSEVDIGQLIDISDSRKGSIDSDAGGNGEIYGGGEVFSPNQFSNGDMGDTKNASKKTAYNEKWGVKVLKAWCTEVNLNPEFEKQSATELNDMLCRFWSEVRKSNGDYYGRNSLFNLRAMINKHLKGKPYCVAFDIVTDERFRTSNEKLESQLKLLKGIGRTITHKQPISLCDLRKMYDTNILGTSNPLALLRKVWFEITLHFCHKGAEAQEKLKKSSFDIFRDVNGLRYVARIGGSNDADEIRMYETGGELCPVKSYELYLSKLHLQQPRLFQQPRRKSTPDSLMWYGKAPIGEKALQQMMANISNAARLSKRYTNHCVRTTALEQFSSSRRKSGNLNRSERTQNTATLSEPLSTPTTFTTHLHALPQQKKIEQHIEQISSASNHVSTDCSSMVSSQSCGHSSLVQQATFPNVFQKDYTSDVTALLEMDSRNIAKRPYVQDFPSYPPPAYADNQSESRPPPNKRMRVEHQSYNQYDSDFQCFDFFPFTNTDPQRRFYQDIATDIDVFQNQSTYKHYSDDSGTGRSVVSPTPISQPEEHYNIYSMQSSSPIRSIPALTEYNKDLQSDGTSKHLTDLSSSSYTSNRITHNMYGNRNFCPQLQQNRELVPSMCFSDDVEKFERYPQHAVKREENL